ncbi:YjbH domain-containing protein, partial [Hydrogenophaga sp.]|uniref:YjbH domain-containing protein n=1 Tax=Hydrogenophaga sp. TaxID=1904254 RepID=UPI003569D448
MPNLLPRSQPAVCATSAAHKSRLALAVSLLMAGAAQAQTLGVSTQGNTGGLSIPSADVLETGSAALSYGNYREPKLRPGQREANYSLGFGLAPNIELFGRFAEYTVPTPTRIVNGVRDLSVNVKLQLPQLWQGQPKVAVGLNDIAG